MKEKDVLFLTMYLEEGIITKNEFNYWIKRIQNEKLIGHPQFIKLYKKYEILFEYYNTGNCSLQNLFDAIEVLEKFNK